MLFCASFLCFFLGFLFFFLVLLSASSFLFFCLLPLSCSARGCFFFLGFCLVGVFCSFLELLCLDLLSCCVRAWFFRWWDGLADLLQSGLLLRTAGSVSLPECRHVGAQGLWMKSVLLYYNYGISLPLVWACRHLSLRLVPTFPLRSFRLPYSSHLST